jgi:hypothetical protein
MSRDWNPPVGLVKGLCKKQFGIVVAIALSAMAMSGNAYAADEVQTSEAVQAPTADTQSATQTASEAATDGGKVAQQSSDAAQTATKAAEQASDSAEQAKISLGELQKLLDNQRKMIGDQKNQIEKQQKQIDRQQGQISSQTKLLEGMQTQLDQLAQEMGKEQAPSDEQVALQEGLASLQEKLDAIPEDPVSAMGEEDFPGSIRVPGTNAAMKIGGFVKATFVKSLDPLQSTDRFVVGSIPVGGASPGVEEETSLTANQTRLNLEMREKTPVGDLRAFVEGDFAGSDDQFRLRHAYGQYGMLLTGKTWSTFYDAQAAPETVDFEGINGRTSLRQTQIRLFPRIGRDWNLQLALEDPNSEVSEVDLTGSSDPGDPNFNENFGSEIISDGVSDLPDFVISVTRDWFKRWHIKTAFVWHQVRAQYSQEARLPVKDEQGWGLSASGSIKSPWFDERDNIKFQLLYGDGVGRYISDTNTVGGQDGVFKLDGSGIKTLPIVAGFGAYQHWWADSIRSTFVASFVDIDNLDFQPGGAYEQTLRLSGNLFWSPTQRVDIGTELLWGKRTNNNGEDADAMQFQIATKFRF